MAYDDFLPEEQQFILQNETRRNIIDECLEDSLNVNPLENGEADLSTYQHTVKAVKLLVEVVRKNLIEGPYGHAHWQLIVEYLDFQNVSEVLEKKFWQLFSTYCAIKKQENENYTYEEIYLKSIVEMYEFLPFDELDLGDGEVFDMNSNSTFKLRGIGVHAIFVDA